MPVTYKNRRGQTYYLHVGRTRTGRKRFFVSTKQDGDLADQVPEGFEIYENPNAMVVVRKQLESLILQEELGTVCEILAHQSHLRSYSYKVDHGKNDITIHLLNENPVRIISYLAPSKTNERNDEDFANNNGTYTPMMRFILRHQEKRLFAVERFCFLGSIDDWVFLAGPDKIEPLATKFLKHLGKESFFDL